MRLFSNDLAGGGILDIGCYCASMARLIAGAALGKPFADPVKLRGTGHLGTSGVDEWATASLQFPGEILAQLSCGISVNQESIVRIYGSEGSILLPNPWQPDRKDAHSGRIIIQTRDDKEPREILVEARDTSFVYEADLFGNALLGGKRQAPSPAMSWDDSLGNMRTLDQWREQIGLVYNQEKPENYRKTTVAGRSLKNPVRSKTPAQMKYGSIPHVGKPVSRLVMGVDSQNLMPHAAIHFDGYFERGGNTFDTAHIYGAMREKLLGHWLKLRGVREDVVVVVKGAHTPWCETRYVTRQLSESLERLQIDYADIYLLHRDDLSIPVGEFIGVLNELVRAGRIKCFGTSNWTLPRVQEANDYAKKHRLQGFEAISNNFSLARMVEVAWAGALSSSDPESREWFKRTQIPLLSWSSQARGFFSEGKARWDNPGTADFGKMWYAEDNFQRLARVTELAKKRNIPGTAIATAYVLNQPFPTFALIGPKKLSDMRESMMALDVTLSPEEMKWLNLED